MVTTALFGMVCLCLVLRSTGLTCYECYSAREPQLCSYHRECGQNEKCGTQRTRNSLGTTVYHLQCLYDTICEGSESAPTFIGRRRRYTYQSEVKCCDTDLCNHGGNTVATTEQLIYPTTVPGCHDNSACENLKGIPDVCHNDDIAIRLCPSMCNQCNDITSGVPVSVGSSVTSGLELTSPSGCRDTSTQCAYLDRTLHMCEHYDVAIHFGCLKTCELCDATTGALYTTDKPTTDVAKPENSTPPKTIPANSTPERYTAENSTPPNTIPANSTLERYTAENSTPQNTIPANSTPEGYTAENSTPQNTILVNSTPERYTAEKSTPSNTIPANSTPERYTAENSTPQNTIPANSIPEPLNTTPDSSTSNTLHGEPSPQWSTSPRDTTATPSDTREAHSTSQTGYSTDNTSCVDDVMCLRSNLDFEVVCKDVTAIHTYKCYNFCRRCDLQFDTTPAGTTILPHTTTPRLCDVTPPVGGEEFVFLYATNKVPSDSHLDLLLASNETGSLTLRGLGGHVCLNYSYTVGSTTIEVPQSLQISKQTIQNKGIQVVTSSDVTLHAMYHDPSTTDGFLILPVGELSDTYVVPSYDKNGIFKTFIGVTATTDDTTLKIKLHTDHAFFWDGNTYNDGDTLTVHLNALEAFELAHTGDVTGTLITSNHPIAVQSGSQCSSVPIGTGTCNHLQEMVLSVSRLGSVYIVPPLVSTQGYIVRIIATYPTTAVDIKNGDHADLSGFILPEVGNFSNIVVKTSALTFINSSHPVLVAHYAEGVHLSEPAMTIIPPVDVFRTEYDIAISDRPGYENYLSIIIPTNHTSDVRINGVDLMSRGDFSIHHSYHDLMPYSYSSVDVKVAPGMYHVTCEPPNTAFGLVVYGVSGENAYEYPGGL